MLLERVFYMPDFQRIANWIFEVVSQSLYWYKADGNCLRKR